MIRFPLFLLALLPCLAAADTFLELDFREAEGTSVKAVAHAPGTPDGGDLVFNAAVEPGPTGIEAGPPGLKEGALRIDGDAKGAALHLTDSKGGKDNYGKSGAWAKSTIVLVFKPNFDRARSQWQTLLGTNASSTQSGFMTWRLRGPVMQVVIGAKDEQAPVDLDVGLWDTSSWYVLVASWETGSSPTLYSRKIGAESGQFLAGSKPVNWSGNSNYSVRLGNGHTLKEPDPENQMDGRLAYLLWTDTYTGTQEAAEALYERLTGAK
jgi:hypothetical protein